MTAPTKAQLPDNIISMLLEMSAKQEQKEDADTLESEANESPLRSTTSSATSEKAKTIDN